LEPHDPSTISVTAGVAAEVVVVVAWVLHLIFRKNDSASLILMVHSRSVAGIERPAARTDITQQPARSRFLSSPGARYEASANN
jgi:hypothetical protein